LHACGLKNILNSRPGIKSHARDIYAGKFHLGGQTIVCNKGSIFSIPLPSREFAYELHSFAWVAHLHVSGRELDLLQCRSLFYQWINRSTALSKGIESSELRADRLLNLAIHAPFILSGANHSFVQLFYSTISNEFCRLLLRAYFNRKFKLLEALAVCVFVFKGFERVESFVERLLSQAVSSEMPDGVSQCRNPARIIDRLSVYRGVAYHPLIKALKFFTLNDGGLAAFHGMNIHSNSFGVGPKGSSSLQDFGRISAGDSTVIIDSKKFLALEICAGSLRLATQLGGPAKADRKWDGIALLPAAHSAPELLEANLTVGPSRLELGDLTITASDGQFIRMVSLSDDGMMITGSDNLVSNSVHKEFLLRFHLDPNCHVEHSPEGRGLLVVKDIQIWHITCENADLTIEDSVSILGRNRPIAAKQICMKRQKLETRTPVYWTFKRVA
jgi:uncharacterized heparinase superfamily protein